MKREVWLAIILFGMGIFLRMNADDLYKHLDIHESMFIRVFIDPDRRKRWAEALGNERKRNSFLVRLADSRDFLESHLHHVNPSPRTFEELLIQFQKKNVPKQCHIISQYGNLDGRNLDLSDAVCNIFGIGLGSIVSCVPGKIAYFEGEMPKDRYFLLAP